MRRMTLFLILAIAALHLYIAYFEMFAWEARGPVVFPDFPADLFGRSKTLAFNQGLYNGFLAAGLIWAVFIGDPKWQWKVATCFLLFVALAGVVGAVTASHKILLVQTGPAVLALALVFLNRRNAPDQSASEST